MKKPIIIGIDVDSTLADSLLEWFNWANKQVKDNRMVTPLDPTEFLKSGMNFKWNQHGEIMQERLGIKNPWMFWYEPKLYKNVKIFPGALTWLKELRKRIDEYNLQGSNIKLVVATTCVPEHEMSKRAWIKKETPGIFDGFIATSDKHLIGLDVIIDDKLEHCENVIKMGGQFALVPEVGIDRPANNPIIHSPETEYGEFWIHMNRVDPTALKFIMAIKK